MSALPHPPSRTLSEAPRVAPATRMRDVGPFAWVVARVAGRVAGTNPPNLFMTLGRHRKLFRGWLRFAGRLMPGGVLPRRETELVIVRVAHLRESAYELEQHAVMARRAGVSAQELERLRVGPGAGGWAPRDQAILQAVDELHDAGDVTDATWAALRDQLSEREAIELVFLVGHYEMLATALRTLRVPVDRRRR